MNYEDYMSVSSEANMLRELLAEIPADHFIDRIGLQARLEMAEEQLSRMNPQLLPRKAKLTFRGRPVIGSHGIAADFAAKAAGAFTDAVAAAAAGLADALNYNGRIPGAEKNQLLLTGTAIGSFGFEFEVPRPEEGSSATGIFDGQSETEVAVEKIQALLDASVSGNDEVLSELVSEIHPRAARKAKDFLDVLVARDATCAIEFQHKVFRFHDANQVSASRDRLSDGNIHETEQEFVGEIQGALPKSRTFEFKIAGKSQIIRGKVGLEIEDADVLNRDYLHHPATILLHVTQVGQGQPRYVLNSLPILGS